MAALPQAPALRVVGRDGTQAQTQVMDAARAQAYAPPPMSAPAGLAGFITDQYTLMRRHRDTVGRGWSDRLLAALRAFDGVYEPNIIEEIKKFGGSNVYARTIAMKCRGTSSLLRDVYLGAERPWGIEPAEDPDVPPEIVQAIGQHIQEEVAQLIQGHFQGLQMQAAHQHATALAHAVGQQQGVHPSVIDQAIPSHASGPSQGAHTGAIPPGALAPPGPGGGGGPPPPPNPPRAAPPPPRPQFHCRSRLWSGSAMMIFWRERARKPSATPLTKPRLPRINSKSVWRRAASTPR